MEIIQKILSLLMEINFSASDYFFTLLSLIGLFLAWYFYKKSIKNKKPCYAVRSVNLIKDSVGKFNNLKITYAGSDVKNLSVARVAFWNSGKETINNDDIAKVNPVRIIGSDKTNFLDLEIIYEKNKSNNFKILPVIDPSDNTKYLQNELNIEFDYFDKDEGIIIQISHTGETGEDIEIIGDIKGFGKVKKIGDPITLINKIPVSSFSLKKLKRKTKLKVIGIFLLITPPIAFATKFIPENNLEFPVYLEYIFIVIIFVLYWTLGFSILKKRVPAGFSMFDDEIISYYEEG